MTSLSLYAERNSRHGGRAPIAYPFTESKWTLIGWLRIRSLDRFPL